MGLDLLFSMSNQDSVFTIVNYPSTYGVDLGADGVAEERSLIVFLTQMDKVPGASEKARLRISQEAITL